MVTSDHSQSFEIQDSLQLCRVKNILMLFCDSIGNLEMFKAKSDTCSRYFSVNCDTIVFMWSVKI